MILLLIAFSVLIIEELRLEEVVVAFLARTDVSLRVRKQVIGAEGQQIEFTDLNKQTIVKNVVGAEILTSGSSK